MWAGDGVWSLSGERVYVHTEGVCIILPAFLRESIRELQKRLAKVLGRNLCGAGLGGKLAAHCPGARSSIEPSSAISFLPQKPQSPGKKAKHCLP